MPEHSSWFRIGHVTNDTGRTGCTVILFDRLVPATVDVRGGAPGTRETAVLDAGRLVGKADAILLTGGSAFGLGAADGVMRYLTEQGRGVPTSTIPVPIVPAAVIYDLGNGAAVWPSADDGYTAAANSVTVDPPLAGQFGAGTGATVAKLGDGALPGGIGIASVVLGSATVTAIVVLNAVGDVVEPATGRSLAAASDPDGRGRGGRDLILAAAAEARTGENTTIGVILIDGSVDRDSLQRCCVAAHDALARCVVPSHTLYDGDTFFAVARQSGELSPGETLRIATATELAVERAIVSIVRGPRPG
jgi:L-aminopeptidase/D-esterase-like protein